MLVIIGLVALVLLAFVSGMLLAEMELRYRYKVCLVGILAVATILPAQSGQFELTFGSLFMLAGYMSRLTLVPRKSE